MPKNMTSVWIFEASAQTRDECFSRGLFGSNINWPLHVKSGDICLLYDYSERMLSGVWLATGNGATNIEVDAWNGRYRFQVRVKRAGTTLQSFPKSSVWRFICTPAGRVLNRVTGTQAHNLIQHFAHDKHEAVMFEREFDKIEDDYRRRFPTDYITQDGHRVRSKSEMIIDDYLYSKRIPHAYEPVVFCGNQKLIPDFSVTNLEGDEVCIEYWGLVEDSAYKARMEFKRSLYAKHHIRLIDVQDSDLRSPDLHLQQKLRNQKIKWD